MMREFKSTGLKYFDGKLIILDQQLLPGSEEWIECRDPDHMCETIYHLKVRGAPLIGVAAALSLANYLEHHRSSDPQLIEEMAARLRKARPTAVNLMAAIDRLLDRYQESGKDAKALIDCAWEICDEDVALCDRMATHGAELIEDGDNILTHCNSGGLATAGLGTALGVIIKAHQQGKKIHVYVDETRPLLQGGRLTAWELQLNEIPYTLICDNMAAFLMAQGKINKVMVGSDRIAANGDFANKIGTYSVAVNASFHKIPFYVVAPYTTVDLDCLSGSQIPVEERPADEVRGASGHFGSAIWAPTDSTVYNPAFDVTPAHLVSGWVMDKGVLSPPFS